MRPRRNNWTRKQGRKLPDSTVLLAKYLAGATYQELADDYGCRKQSVHEQVQQFARLLGTDPETIRMYQTRETEILDATRFRVLSELLGPDRLAAASAKDLAIVYGITFDKARLLRGQSTANLSSRVEAVIHAHSLSATPRPSTPLPHAPELALEQPATAVRIHAQTDVRMEPAAVGNRRLQECLVEEREAIGAIDTVHARVEPVPDPIPSPQPHKQEQDAGVRSSSGSLHDR